LGDAGEVGRDGLTAHDPGRPAEIEDALRETRRVAPAGQHESLKGSPDMRAPHTLRPRSLDEAWGAITTTTGGPMLARSIRASGQHHMRKRAGSVLPRHRDRGIHHEGAPFAPLIDAKAAGQLLGVPHTWLLAQARAGRIPHHRLGHYVRFSADDLKQWLVATRIGDTESRLRCR
jgi:excisionase family DNA binding protein